MTTRPHIAPNGVLGQAGFAMGGGSGNGIQCVTTGILFIVKNFQPHI
jgi:hypothetical protein